MEHKGHGEIIKAFLAEHKEIFESSDQAIYVFLDDDCRVCNDKFAKLLGYESPEEWMNVDVKGAFPDAFVDNDSQHDLVSAYQDAMNSKNGSTIKVTWKKKSGGTVDTTVILVPISFSGSLMALHFIS